VRLALTRQPSPNLVNGELTYLTRSPISLGLAEMQHGAYCAALAAAGCEVVTLPAVAEFPDSVFVEDVAVVLDELAVLTRPGALSRQGEVALIEAALAPHRTVTPLLSENDPLQPASPTLEGGDVLRLGRTLYVGQSTRTNAAGAEALRRWVAPFHYKVVPVEVTGCLHLKTGATAVDEATLLVNPDWIDTTPLRGFELIPVHPDEPWAANVLRLDSTLFASDANPRTCEVLVHRGYEPQTLNISEFAKLEAGLTCLSLLLS
jgi:dimethylargininase